MTSITNPVCEYRFNPLGIDVAAPRLGWQMQTGRRGARQTAYRILAAGDPQQLRAGEANLWDSGKIETDQSIHIPYAGQKLRSRQWVYWQVTVWDETSQPTTAIRPGFGDWLSINADIPRDLIGTAFLAYDVGLMA